MNTQFLNTQVLKPHSLKFFRPKSLLIFLALATGVPTSGLAGDLALSNNALEVVTGVEPNIMIVADDSTSMDMSIMTDEDGITGGWLILPGNTWYYAYAHPAPGASGFSPAINHYGYFNTAPYTDTSWFNLPTQEYFDNIGEGDQGIWRGRNKDHNRIYYDPDVTYEPWEGVDSSGNPFTDADPNAARYNPYNSADGTMDLEQDTTYYAYCPAAVTGCATGAFQTIDDGFGNPVSHILQITGFWPARYYEWTDSNSDNDVDATDGHTLVEIKSGNTYTRTSESSGGRSDCTDNGDGTATCSYAQELQNFANWFSYYRKRDLAAKAAIGAGVKPAESARIGYATINSRINSDTARNIRVASMNVSPDSGNKRSLLDKVYGENPSLTTTAITDATWVAAQLATPLKQALVDTGEYFSCGLAGVDKDIFGGSAGNCPIEAAPAGQCQQNYTILMTDGYYDDSYVDKNSAFTAHRDAAVSFGTPDCNNGGDPNVICFTGGTVIGDTDDDNDTDYDGGAFGDSVDAVGTFRTELADIAMYYYENDLSSQADEVPTTTIDIERYRGATDPFETMHQHMTTYSVAFGVETSLTAGPATVDEAFDWTTPVVGNNTTIDDLAHAAINGRGEYLNASNPDELVTKMESIFNDIETSTGTATAVAFNTQEVEAGTLVFRASFNTKTNKGDLVAQRVYPNGTVSSSILWSAAEQLDSKTTTTGDSRTIVTYQDTGSSTSTGSAFSWSGTNLTAGQKALLNLPTAVGEERVGYLRGQSENEGATAPVGNFRSRAEREGKLGDIVHSTPVFVGKPPFLGRTSAPFPVTAGNTYAEFKTAQAGRTQLTYVGANDGMLHAFDTSDGSEHFAYVPNIVIENLSDLTDPAYSHQYYVDLRPAINDAYITPSSGTNASTLSWNTVLVGGLAGGGKGYFALNITDPEDLDTESEARTNVMWEFTEADDGGVGNSDLGYSFSEPLIAMTNDDDGSGNKEWWAFFGNGYNSTSTDGDAALYMLKLEGGQDGVWTSGTDFHKVTTGFGKAESADGTTPNGISGVRGVDTDANGTVDYIYAGDLQGNLIRFDLTSTSSASWGTRKLLFQTKYSTDPAQRLAGGSGTRQPITSRPIVIKHPDVASEHIVIVATGSWMTTGDATNQDIQSIYGIWDDMTTGGPDAADVDVTMISGNNQLVEQVFTNHASAEHGFTVRSLTNNAVTWKNNGLDSSKVKGWYIDLDVPVAGGGAVEYPGERAVRNLQIRGGLLFVNTIIPKATNACAVGAGGFELAFNPETGGSGSTIIFDVNGDGSFDDSDNIGDASGDGNIITGIRFDTDTPTDSAFIGSRRMTQEGDDIRSFDTNTGSGSLTGRTSWREIVQ